MICNNCPKLIDPQQGSIWANTECGMGSTHIWCRSCVQKMQRNRNFNCQRCRKSVNSNSMFQIQGNPFSNYNDLSSEKKYCLFGYSPQVILQIAMKAINFWDKQKVIKYNRARRFANEAKKIVQAQKQKLLTQQQQIKNAKKEIIHYKQTVLKYKSEYNKCKQAYIKMKNRAQSLTANLKQRNVQIQNIQNKYKTLRQQQQQQRNQQQRNQQQRSQQQRKRRKSPNNRSTSSMSSHHSRSSQPQRHNTQRNNMQINQNRNRNRNRLTQQTVPETQVVPFPKQNRRQISQRNRQNTANFFSLSFSFFLFCFCNTKCLKR